MMVLMVCDSPDIYGAVPEASDHLQGNGVTGLNVWIGSRGLVGRYLVQTILSRNQLYIA
jgi:hypothetical protein